MKAFKTMARIIEWLLAIAQVIFLVLIFQDNSLTPFLKYIVAPIINGSLFIYILANIYRSDYVTSNKWAFSLSSITGVGLLVWYSYYTWIDIANSSYSNIMSTIYVTADIFTLFYLALTIILNSIAFGASTVRGKILIDNVKQFVKAKLKWATY